MMRFDDIFATEGDDIEIPFTVYDRNEDLVPLSGCTATFRIAYKCDGTSLLELTETDGITLADSVATVAFNTDQIADDLVFDNYQAVFIGQLRITKSGKSMVAAEGEIRVGRLIE